VATLIAFSPDGTQLATVKGGVPVRATTSPSGSGMSRRYLLLVRHKRRLNRVFLNDLQVKGMPWQFSRDGKLLAAAVTLENTFK